MRDGGGGRRETVKAIAKLAAAKLGKKDQARLAKLLGKL
jgi:hypothetical protein